MRFGFQIIAVTTVVIFTFSVVAVCAVAVAAFTILVWAGTFVYNSITGKKKKYFDPTTLKPKPQAEYSNRR